MPSTFRTPVFYSFSKYFLFFFFLYLPVLAAAPDTIKSSLFNIFHHYFLLLLPIFFMNLLNTHHTYFCQLLSYRSTVPYTSLPILFSVFSSRFAFSTNPINYSYLSVLIVFFLKSTCPRCSSRQHNHFFLMPYSLVSYFLFHILHYFITSLLYMRLLYATYNLLIFFYIYL